jgi:hypothetical protein
MQDLKNKTFVGIVKDNNDPKKMGRCKIHVMNVFDDLQVSDLPWATPWKDLNGNTFIVPDVGKVVSVVFDDGNIYKPEFIFAEHFNANLEKKLSELSGSSYTSMRALMFDHKTQIYSNDAEGLKIDYKFNNINLNDASINLNLKDNKSGVNIGSSNANQQVILGNHFLNWFDEFVQNLLSLKTGPFLVGGSPVVPAPEFIRCLTKYSQLREAKFLSHHVRVVDNNYVSKQERVAVGQVGDNWRSTKESGGGGGSEGSYSSGSATTENVDYKPTDANSTDQPIPENGVLTTSSNVFGVLNPKNQATDPGKILPSNNPDVDKILNAMKRKKYVILSRPYEVNIVAIRNQYEGQKYSNAFKDDLYLLFKTDDTEKWEIKKYPISTLPGYYQAVETLRFIKGVLTPSLVPPNYRLAKGESYIGNTKDGKPIDVKLTEIMVKRGGMGIMKPAQYLDCYHIASWIGEKAMFTKGHQLCYRDKTEGPIIKWEEGGAGNWGFLIHCGFSGNYTSVTVDNWSEGCQVFCKKSDLDDFFKWCEMHKKKYVDAFNYTLMTGKDLEDTGSLSGQLFPNLVNAIKPS